MAPPNRLPPEILGYIFILWADAHYDEEGYELSIKLVDILLVCRLWRDIVYDTPRLWSTPHFRYPQYAKHMLKLAKSTPLNLVWTNNTIDIGPNINPERFMREFETVKLFLWAIAHPSGIVSLRLQGRKSILELLLSQMIHPLPHLRSITIQCTSIPLCTSFPENFLGGNAPCLSKLNLDTRKFQVPWGSPILQNLTYLSAPCEVRHHRLSDLIRGLQELQHLETLHLRYYLPKLDTYHTRHDLGVRAELPRLRDLTVRSPAVLYCSRLLEGISFPRTISLTLGCAVLPLAEESHIERLFGRLKGLFSQDVVSNAIDSSREVKSLQLCFRDHAATRTKALFMHINVRSQGDDQADDSLDDMDGQEYRLSRLSLTVFEDLNGSSTIRGVRDMFGDLPYLRRLSLESHFEDEDVLVRPLLDRSTLLTWVCLRRKAPVVSFLEALGRGLSQSATGTVEETTVFLPALRTLELHSVDFEGILQLLEVLVLRKENGFPIEKLVLRDVGRMESRLIEQIAGVVKVLDWDSHDS
ncbi:hypothetical protein PQX77_010546 [Marasmius sp. AFHP31]|nr:hypothetical protein PQX77_010546 [Marasmius sp. AFHP31]